MGHAPTTNTPELELLLPTYREVKPTLDVGDVVLFGGQSSGCMRIKSWTGSRWSHAALIYRTHGVKQPLLLESTSTSLVPDLITGKIQTGVTLVELEAWLRNYATGEIAIRRLKVDRTPKIRQRLRVFFEKMHGRAYETSSWQMFQAVYDGPFGASSGEDLSSLFCSELLAACYQRMGLLPFDPPSNEYVPADFSSDARKPLPLLEGATLEPEILLREMPIAA